MMKHEGQYNSNGTIQNHWESTEALVVASSPSPHTGSIHSSPNSLNGPNFLPYREHLNIVQTHDHDAGVIHHNLDLNAEYVENGHYTNNQSDSNLSDLMASDSGRSYVVDGLGADNSLVNMSYLSSNRSPEHAPKEFLTDESSRSIVQARSPISQAATIQANTNNSLNTVTPYIGTANFHQPEFAHETVRSVSSMQQLNEARHGYANSYLFSFEAGTFHGITWPVFDMVHFSHAGLIGRFQSNNQTVASPPAFVPSSNLLMWHAGNFHALFLPQYHQQDHPPFFSQAQASVGAILHGQLLVQFPNFHYILLPAPWVSVIIGPIRIGPPFLPVYTMLGGGNPDNTPRNIMLGYQIGMDAQTPYLVNLGFDHGTANFLGNFASPSYYGPYLLNAPTGFPWFNAYEHHIPMLFGVGNSSAPPSIGFPVPSINNQPGLTPPAISRESDLNIGPPFVARNNLLTQVQDVVQRLPNVRPMRIQGRQDEHAGLSEELITAHLRREEFQSPKEETLKENVESCVICLEHFADGDNTAVVDCRHKFHFDCLKDWLRIKNTCPLCVGIVLAVGRP